MAPSVSLGIADPSTKHDQVEVSNPPVRPRRARWLLAGLVLLLIGGAVYYRGFCNWPLHSEQWTRSRIDQAISNGLSYLAGEGTFGRPLARGGELTPHHFFLERVLAYHPHEGLGRQLQRAKQLNDGDWQWRAYFGMPGWPLEKLTATDRAYIRAACTNRADAPYPAWLTYGLYPDWVELRPEDRRPLLENTRELKSTYDLTHALLTYLWMQEVAPAAASRLRVNQLIEQVNRRLCRIQEWDPCTGDLYNERVAFWLYMKNGPPVKRRWIERILLSQNSDGGWSYHKSVDRTFGQFLGIDSGNHPSHPHPTFLALFALSEYARKMNTTHDSAN